MAKKPEKAIDEDGIVRMLRSRFGTDADALSLGIGDDAAVFHSRGPAADWVVTTDMLLEEVDFHRSWITPGQLGHKSLAVNLSDLAAMGARPRYFLVALALPPDITPGWIRAFYRGASRLAKPQGAVLIGGDLSRSPSGVQVTITAIGECGRRRAVGRKGGKAGDFLYVTGVLGRAAAGLFLLESGKRSGATRWERSALLAHRTPPPRCEVGIWLAQNRWASCMMDLSDGLSTDLPRLCRASGTGALVYASQLPVFAAARAWGCDPVDFALNGGEDFELLFAVSPSKAARFEAAWPRRFVPVSRIGRLCRRRGTWCAPAPGAPPLPLASSGFDHFRR